MGEGVYRISDIPKPLDWYKPALGKCTTLRNREVDIGTNAFQYQQALETKTTYVNASPQRLVVKGIHGLPMRFMDKPNCRSNEFLIITEIFFEHSAQFDINELQKHSTDWDRESLDAIMQLLESTQLSHNVQGGAFRQQPGRLVLTYAFDVGLLKDNPQGVYLEKFNLYIHVADGIEREHLPYEGFPKATLASHAERDGGVKCYYNSHSEEHKGVWIVMGMQPVCIADNALDVKSREGLFVEVRGESKSYTLEEMKSNGYYFSERAAVEAMNISNADKAHLLKDTTKTKIEEFNNVTTAIGGISKMKPALDFMIQCFLLIRKIMARGENAGSSTA